MAKGEFVSSTLCNDVGGAIHKPFYNATTSKRSLPTPGETGVELISAAVASRQNADIPRQKQPWNIISLLGHIMG
jgi:hypothetical protein